jgi:hAT family C-terminal dimerisation region
VAKYGVLQSAVVHSSYRSTEICVERAVEGVISSSKANTLKLALCSCEFIVSVFCLSDVLSLTVGLSTKLQSVSIDFCAAKNYVIDVIAVLTKRREAFDNFDTIFDSACHMMEMLDVTVAQPRITKSQRNRPNPPATTPNEFYRRTIYLPLLDAITTDLRSRFSDEILGKLDALSCFIPSFIIVGPDRFVTSELFAQYKTCLTEAAEPSGELRLRGEFDIWKQKWLRLNSLIPKPVIPSTAAEGLAACDKEIFPMIHSLLTILVCMPVSTASAERSFSTLRRLKTWLRSRMGQERLLGLALLNVHRDISVSVDHVIDRFSNSKRRNLDFVV